MADKQNTGKWTVLGVNANNVMKSWAFRNKTAAGAADHWFELRAEGVKVDFNETFIYVLYGFQVVPYSAEDRELSEYGEL